MCQNRLMWLPASAYDTIQFQNHSLLIKRKNIWDVLPLVHVLLYNHDSSKLYRSLVNCYEKSSGFTATFPQTKEEKKKVFHICECWQEVSILIWYMCATPCHSIWSRLKFEYYYFTQGKQWPLSVTCIKYRICWLIRPFEMHNVCIVKGFKL